MERDNCGLVLVDVDKEANDMLVQMVTDYDPKLGQYVCERIYDVVLPNTIRLVQFFRDKKLPIIFVQWDWHKYQYPPLEPRKDEPVVQKTTTGAFASTNL